VVLSGSYLPAYSEEHSEGLRRRLHGVYEYEIGYWLLERVDVGA